MFNIFKKIKQLTMTKDQLEQENGQLKEALSRLNTIQKEQTTTIEKLNKELFEAMGRVRYLAEQLKMKDIQEQTSERFNDNDRNY
jgi:formiminotetrahydrofolate cyclodeaminase